jgi:hypothetical protein
MPQPSMPWPYLPEDDVMPPPMPPMPQRQEGDTQINPYTGRKEIFLMGEWRPNEPLRPTTANKLTPEDARELFGESYRKSADAIMPQRLRPNNMTFIDSLAPEPMPNQQGMLQALMARLRGGM